MFKVIGKKGAEKKVTKRLYPSCAVVGSSPELVGRELGSVIDDYRTIIRVNSLPKKGTEVSFGRKTSFFIANCLLRRKGPKYLSTLSKSQLASIEAVVFKRCGGVRLHPGWLQGPQALLEFRKEPTETVQRFEPRCGLTTGLQAILSFMPLCGRLRLFGFGDPRGFMTNQMATLDGHGQDAPTVPHWFDWEHEVIAHLTNKSTPNKIPGAAEAASWWRSHPRMRAMSSGSVIWA